MNAEKVKSLIRDRRLDYVMGAVLSKMDNSISFNLGSKIIAALGSNDDSLLQQFYSTLRK